MKKITLLILFGSFLLTALQDATAQTTITIKPPVGALDDALVSSNPLYVNTNSGTATAALLMTWTCSSVLCHAQSYLNFDLSAIPSTATINSANLYLYADVADAAIAGQPTYGTNNAGWIRRVTTSWNESSITWNNQPASTTTNQVTIPQSTSTAQDYIVDVTVLVQDMIDNPSTSFGFTLLEQNQTTYYNSLIFASNDNPDTSLTPKLVITYTDASSVNDIYTDGAAVRVYPNPASDEVRIESSRFKMQGIDVYNMLGAKIMHRNVNKADYITLNVHSLPAGVYFVSIQDEKNNLVSRKLIITR